MRICTCILLLSVAFAASLGITLAHELPETPDDAFRYAQSSADAVSDVYQWTCPTGDGPKTCYLRMEVSGDDFESSMHRNVMRVGTVFVPAPYTFILPDDPYVRTIASHIMEETEGLSDELRLTAALWFVQSAISYSYDSDLYGTEDFWAYPLETLYLHRGDCEDTSVLFASIAEAMGFDTVLLDYPGHVAVGVRMTVAEGSSYALDDGTYVFCETTCSSPYPLGSYRPSVLPDAVWHPSEEKGTACALNSGIAGYRYLFQRILGI